MLEFLKARVPTAEGKPDPEKVKAFSEANPETLNQARYVAARALPASFATTTYWGVHAFEVTNVDGRTRYGEFTASTTSALSGSMPRQVRSRLFVRRPLEDRTAGGGFARRLQTTGEYEQDRRGLSNAFKKLWYRGSMRSVAYMSVVRRSRRNTIQVCEPSKDPKLN
jgi:hypothetical protein